MTRSSEKQTVTRKYVMVRRLGGQLYITPIIDYNYDTNGARLDTDIARDCYFINSQ